MDIEYDDDDDAEGVTTKRERRRARTSCCRRSRSRIGEIKVRLLKEKGPWFVICPNPCQTKRGAVLLQLGKLKGWAVGWRSEHFSMFGGG